MTDNRGIFDTVRPWLDSDGFNRPGRIDALNAACDRFRANPANGIIFEEVRPWLDRRGFTAERITALNAACDALRSPASAQSIGEGVRDAAEAGAALGGLLSGAPQPTPAPQSRKTIADFIGGFIHTHEGGLSMDPADNGNWTGGRRGAGALVGSKFGVTPGAIAMYRGVPASSITRADVANLTKEEAVAIGVRNYYERPGFDKLPWNRVTLSIVDKGWGSGPGQAIKLLQRMVGVPATAKIDGGTVAAYSAFIAQHGEEAAARKWADVRIAFDTSLGQPRFIKGWNNRTRSFLPGTPWWGQWA